MAGVTGPQNTIAVPSVLDQVQTYLKGLKQGAHVDKTLFVVLGGANDVLFNPNATASAATDRIKIAVEQLKQTGRRVTIGPV